MAEFTEEQKALAQALEQERFYSINDSGKTDTFVRAWITIRTNAEMGVNFFTRKLRRKNLTASMEELKITAYASASEAEKAVYEAEWKSFAERYIKLCYQDKGYGSTLFGLVHEKKTFVTDKILTEISVVTESYPQNFGEKEKFAKLGKIMSETLEEIRGDYETEADK